MRRIALTACINALALGAGVWAQGPPAPEMTPAARADAEHERGVAAERRGLLVQAIGHHERELQIASAAGLRPVLARAYNDLADLSINQGQQARFFEYAQRAFDLIDNPDDRDRALYLLRVGVVYDELEDIARAGRSHEEAYALATRLGDAVLTARILNSWAILYQRTRIDPARSRRYFDEALAVLSGRTERDALDVRMAVLNNYGNQFRDDPATAGEALRRYGEGLALARQLGRVDALLLKNTGRAFRILGRHTESERALRAAVQNAEADGITRIRWQARMELGTLLADRKPDEAERHYLDALDVLEAQHANVLLEDYRAGSLGGNLSMYDNPYDLLVRLLLRRGRVADAFAIAERARARTFLDVLAGTRDAMAAQVPEAFVAEERALLRRLSDDQAKLRARTLRPQARRAVETAIQTHEDRLAAMRIQLAADIPAVAHARFPRLPTPEDVQRSTVGPDEALLEYFLGADESTAWVIRRDGVWAVTLSPRREIDAAVRPYIAALSSPDGRHVEVGRRVADLLWQPVAARLDGVRRVTIAPDGVLHYLPFEALVDRDGRHLIESRAIAYTPSAASLAYLRSRPAPEAGDVVAIGNPVMSATGVAQDRGVPIAHLRLMKSLPHTARELDAIAETFAAARVLQQEHATESRLHGAGIERAAVLHFATHGLIDEDVPQRSGLALTEAPGTDGILQMREIYGLRLRAALVSLSACETALGKDVTGEGIVGLTRAFLHAGAGAVLASLWNVNDASTAALMARFYGALAEGGPIDEAARDAKLAFLAGDARLRHPYYWAAFVVTGNASAPVRVVTPPGPRVELVASAIVVALLAAGLLIARRRAAGAPGTPPHAAVR
ncbi:MAG: CHAT domain-containing protein [Acidimicrobiia bacterium]|nr:CHAT domain-containing protein [Acidimicrobiia bacterium]